VSVKTDAAAGAIVGAGLAGLVTTAELLDVRWRP